jgi:hypothetical protein
MDILHVALRGRGAAAIRCQQGSGHLNSVPEVAFRVPHDEISPKRRRQRLDARADIRQRIEDLYRTLIGTVAKRAPF